MIKNVKAITLSSYLAMFFLGVGTSLLGAAARNIGLSAVEIGLLVAVQNVGFIGSVLIAGALADNHDKTKILLVGSLLLAFSFFAFYASPLFWVNLGLMLVFGTGMGVYEGVTDAMLLELHPHRAGLHINVNHFFVTFGSVMIAAYLLFLQMNWRQSVIQSGLIILLLAVFFGLAKLKNRPKQAERLGARLHLLSRDRRVVALAIVTILATGVEIGAISLLTTFLVELRGFSPVTANIGLIIFLVGVAAGRLLIGFVTRRGHIVSSLLTLVGLAVLFFSGLLFLDLGQWIYPAIFLAGLALSAILPLIITLTGLLYQEMAGTAMGVIKTAIPVGGIVLPFLISVVTQYGSFQLSLALFPLAFLLAFGVLFWEIQPQARREKAWSMD
ncbi:MAG: MFS transporter [Anaerolineales bacterium]|nr:MFS transporter [Anaerolineales bacterium]